MKTRLLIFISAFLFALTANAQTDDKEGTIIQFHNKVEDARITIDCTPEQVTEFLLEKIKGHTLFPNTALALKNKRTDRYGNHHIAYSQLFDGKPNYYQAILHFRPDGTLFYTNGNLAMMQTEEAAKVKAFGRRATITAEEAAIIATNDASSETHITLVNYKNKPREAYKVLNQSTMQHIYVDVYSGEILFSTPLFRDYAPWDEVHGTPATIKGNTTYNGLQDIDVMLTENGYVLRDPKRNIVTVDATDKLDNYEKTFPKSTSQQCLLLTETSEDFIFADEQQLADCEYTTTLNNITFNYYTYGGDRPKPVKVHIYYVDDNKEPLDDIIEVTLSDTAWVRELTRYKLSYTLPEPLDINLLDKHHVVKITFDGYIYTIKNLMIAGDKTEAVLTTDEIGVKKMTCIINVGVNASQPALDVHWGIQQVYDMYHDYFGIKGCDNKGTQIVNIVNPINRMNLTNDLPRNSSAMPTMVKDCHDINSFMMIYGLGQTGIERCVTTLDVTAHEYTHNVTEGYGNQLQYKDETGALDEAIADCMAMITEYYVTGQPSWEMGEDSYLNANNMRSLSDPWLSGSVGENISESRAQPKYYGGQYWIDYNTTDIDQGGVHTNSGVFNYLFYLLCEGAIGVTNEMGETDNISPIGMDAMKDIIFHSMMYYNSGLCDYEEIADNMLIAAEDINGQNTEAIKDMQQKMSAAFTHVGMSSSFKPTGINSHQSSADMQQDTPAYDLNGMPAANDYKGIVIKNGKKILMK